MRSLGMKELTEAEENHEPIAQYTNSQKKQKVLNIPKRIRTEGISHESKDSEWDRVYEKKIRQLSFLFL
jgi:hypothetical protein